MCILCILCILIILYINIYISIDVYVQHMRIWVSTFIFFKFSQNKISSQWYCPSSFPGYTSLHGIHSIHTGQKHAVNTAFRASFQLFFSTHLHSIHSMHKPRSPSKAQVSRAIPSFSLFFQKWNGFPIRASTHPSFARYTSLHSLHSIHYQTPVFWRFSASFITLYLCQT